MHDRREIALLQKSISRTVLVYLLFGIAWITCSDPLLVFLIRDPESLALANMVKGWLYVGVTSLLLFFLLREQIKPYIRARQERRRVVDLLENIASNSNDAIFAKDREGCYLFYNRAASLSVGQPVEAVLGRDDRAIFPAEQAAQVMEIDRRIMRTGNGETHELTIDTPNGKRVYLATKAPLHDESGSIFGVFGISSDITGRKQAEEALRASEDRFRGLVEQSMAGIYIIQDDRFRYVNPGFTAIFGYNAPEEIIERLSPAELIAPEDRALVAENIRKRLSGESASIHYEFTGLRRDDQQIIVEVHGCVFQYQGRPAVIGLLLDITRRKSSERELHQRNEELERFNRATVDRELDMIRLKKTINALSGELGREAPFPLSFLQDEEKNSA